MSKSLKLTLRITFMATYTALVYAMQVALAVIPNVEVVTLLLILAGVCLPLSMSLTISLAFATLETITYGVADWVILYFTIWPLLILIAWALRIVIRKFWWIAAIIAALFGYLFGAFDALIKLALYDQGTAWAYYLKGIIFDLVHGTSNFIITLVLFKPLYIVIMKYGVKYFHLSTDSYLWRIIFDRKNKQTEENLQCVKEKTTEININNEEQ